MQPEVDEPQWKSLSVICCWRRTIAAKAENNKSGFCVGEAATRKEIYVWDVI